MKQQIKILLLFMFLSSCVKTQLPLPETLYLDYLARQEIKAEKYEEALAQYYTMLDKDQNRPSTHSNIGVLLNMVQKPEEALKSLQHALKLAEQQKDAKDLFAINYNLGVYFGAAKKIDEALLHYQAALDIVPASIETKTNIELLIQQQQQDQKNKQGQGESKENQQGGEGLDKQDQKDQKDQQDKKDKPDEKDENKDQDGKDKKDEPKKEDQKKESSAKYKPRPFKGDQLSEGDVKKILGELRNQEQKIRANFDKKEKGKSKANEKDW